MKNWAGNYEFKAARVHWPTTVEEIQAIVADAVRAKAKGTRHSFNDIADTAGDLVSTSALDRVIGMRVVPEESAGSVLVEPGVRYGDLARMLAKHGRTLANFASLPHITVGGSVATSTHGSGVNNKGLASAVREIRMVLADGSTRSFRRGDEGFEGAVVGLGALGIVVALELDTVPMFEVAQTVYEGLRWKELEREFDAVLSGAYSVSLFHDWRGDRIPQVWVKRTEGPSAPEYFGAKAADGPRHPLPEMPTENCTSQMGVYGPAPDRLPHFRMEFTPSGGEELQSEYILPRERAYASLSALDPIRDRIAPLLFVTEVRTVAGDGLWLSPFYGRDSVCVHFTWRPLQAQVEALLPEIEAGLAPFGARPHWGKLFAGRVDGLYPRLGDFRALARELDPEGKFRNAYLERSGVL